MGARVTSEEDKVAIYDSVTGYPVQTPVFDDPERAERFILWVTTNYGCDIRSLDSFDLEHARRDFESFYAANAIDPEDRRPMRRTDPNYGVTALEAE